LHHAGRKDNIHTYTHTYNNNNNNNNNNNKRNNNWYTYNVVHCVHVDTPEDFGEETGNYFKWG
jgi:hypothetical protein